MGEAKQASFAGPARMITASAFSGDSAASPFVAPVCRPLSRLAETGDGVCASAACYRGPEYVGVIAVVVAELKFRDVQRQILAAHLVEIADDAALKQRPEAFNRLRVNRAVNVLLVAMIDGRVRVAAFFQANVDAVFIGREQANLVGNDFANEGFRIAARHLVENAGDHIAFAADRANHGRLIRAIGASAEGALVPMLVLVLAADEGLINLDNA